MGNDIGETGRSIRQVIVAIKKGKDDLQPILRP